MIVEELVKALNNVLASIVSAIPIIILALLIILLGYAIGYLARKAIRFIFDKTLWRFARKTTVGRKFEEAEVNPGDVVGVVVMGIIVALSILLAINAIGLTGPAVNFIATFISLLIGVLGGVVILVLGVPLAALAGEYLAKLIGLS
ncbi:MAG: hypothetical protein QXM43_05530, partial [Desulfurococcaceae archaeon]